eukprot:1566378-Rhodomonas_salina.1
MSQRLAPSQHPRQPPRSLLIDLVVAQAKTSQRLALPQHPHKHPVSLITCRAPSSQLSRALANSERPSDLISDESRRLPWQIRKRRDVAGRRGEGGGGALMRRGGKRGRGDVTWQSKGGEERATAKGRRVEERGKWKEEGGRRTTRGGERDGMDQEQRRGRRGRGEERSRMTKS